ncbi:hypothetical protein [uncultured Rhodoblastus sp.]|uniref:hypothetical protein n=1 Tax=uncultured Rhodoblastus sp. TaxID=543037 RepID=UPI0025CD9A6E|nr:hypothetical protein [uncultured Rhodoblastus sp.]
MSQAYIIECGDDDAGIVTRETRGFLFHAANRTYRRLEGRTFETLRKAQLAAEALQREKLASQGAQELPVLPARNGRAF